jgi:hypothetical protein
MFPVWPHAEHVEKCRELADPDEAPSRIPLDQFLDILLSQFEADGTMIAAFQR